MADEPGSGGGNLRRQLREMRKELPPLQQELLEVVEAARRLEADAAMLGQADVVAGAQRAAERLRTTAGALVRAQRILDALGEETAAKPSAAPS